MQINLNYQKGFTVQLFQILLFQLIFTADLTITNLLIYTDGNIYLNAWTKFPLNNRQPSTVKTHNHKRPPIDVNWIGNYHKCIYWKFVQKSSGSAFSIILFIGRVLSGGMFMTIQEFYPKNG